MFSEDIVLRGWMILVKGRANALSETRKNFEAAKSLQIETIRVFESDCSVAGELKILVDGEIELFVVDVLEFSPIGKVTSIRAYLGRSN
jgi:steroid delta-isomerase